MSIEPYHAFPGDPSAFSGGQKSEQRIKRHAAGFTLVELMVVVAVIGVLAAIAIPNFLRSRKRSQATITLKDVRSIDAAKGEFALESRSPATYVPNVADIKPYLQAGSRLTYNTQLSNFRDLFGNVIQMGDLDTLPLIDDATRDMFVDVIPDNAAFWGSYCR